MTLQLHHFKQHMKTKFIFLLLLVVQLQSFAQNITAKIVDAQSNEPLPYANIRINGSTDLISNNEGYFNISENGLEETSVLKISFIGYISKQLTYAELKNQNFLILLTPASFEIDNITISNKNDTLNDVHKRDIVSS